MRRRRYAAWLVCAAAIVCAPWDGAAARSEPQQLELRLSDGTGFEKYWSIDVASSGHVTRTEDAPPGPLGPSWISPEARERLRSLLTAQRFYSLASGYGSCVFEGRARTITATSNGRRHKVMLCDLPVRGSGEEARALRVWYGALSELAKDVRIEKDDARVLDERK